MNSDKKDNWTSISAPTPHTRFHPIFPLVFSTSTPYSAIFPTNPFNWTELAKKLDSNSFESNHHSSLVLIIVLSLMGKNTKAPMMVLSKDLSLDHACISEFHKLL